MPKHIEAEGGELLIQTSKGYTAIIPKNMASWVKEHIKSGNHAVVDNYVKNLKEVKKVTKAEDGAKMELPTKEEPTYKGKMLPEVVVRAQANPTNLFLQYALDRTRPAAMSTGTDLEERGLLNQAAFEQQQLYNSIQEGDFDGKKKELFEARYGTSPHRWRYDTDPAYKKEVDDRMEKTQHLTGTIDLPATNIFSKKYAGNPNLAFMTHKGMSPEGKRALEESNLGIIGAVLPIPGLETVGKIPSIAKLGGKVLQREKLGATLTHPDVKEIVNFPKPSESAPESLVLADFKARIQTPEGRRRLQKLGLLGDKELQELRIVNTSTEPGAYYPDINYATVNPAERMPANIARHEIEHAVQSAYQSGREKVYGTEFDPFPYMKSHRVTPGQTDIDRSMAMLETWDEPLKNKKEWDDFSKSYSYQSATNPDKDKMALNYFFWGSNGREKSAFLGEVQQYMLDKKLINHPYQRITMDDIKNAYKTAVANKDELRLFNIMKPNPYNFSLLRDNLNKMLSITGAAGTGAAAYKSDKKK